MLYICLEENKRASAIVFFYVLSCEFFMTRKQIFRPTQQTLKLTYLYQ